MIRKSFLCFTKKSISEFPVKNTESSLNVYINSFKSDFFLASVMESNTNTFLCPLLNAYYGKYLAMVLMLNGKYLENCRL